MIKIQLFLLLPYLIGLNSKIGLLNEVTLATLVNFHTQYFHHFVLLRRATCVHQVLLNDNKLLIYQYHQGLF